MTVANPEEGNTQDQGEGNAPVPANDIQRALLEIVRVLAEQIGPRPSAGEGERLAAAFMIDRLRKAGYQVELEPFAGLTTFSWTYALPYTALALAGFLGRRWPRLGAVLGMGAFAAFLAENLGFATLSRLPALPRDRSQNVVARLPLPDDAPAEPPGAVLLVAHLDSARAALPFHPRLVGRFRESFLAYTVAMATVAAGGLLRLLLHADDPERRRLDRVVVGAAALLVAPLAALLHREASMPFVAGANDNASGAAVALAAAERLAALLHARPDRKSELWVVFTGCAESGLGGMQRFLAAHGAELDRANTVFLNVDTVGAGTLTIVNQEGMLWPLLADHDLVDAATHVALRRGLDFQTRGFHTLPTDAQVPLSRGYRALTLLAFDEHGHLPNWHWPSDTWEQIDPTTMESAYDLVVRLVRRLVAGPGQRIG